MKRYLPIAAIAVAAAYPALAAQAMPGHGGGGTLPAAHVQRGSGVNHRLLVQIFKRDAHGVHRVARLRESARPSAFGQMIHQVNGHAVQSTSLRAHLSGSDLAVGTVDGYAPNGQSSPGQAAGPFQYFHSAYSGFQSASATEWDFQGVTFTYQGSVFVNSTSAFAYAQVGYETVETSDDTTGPIDCGSLYGTVQVDEPFCRTVGYSAANNQQGYYAVASVDHCAVESDFEGDPNYISTHWDTVTGFWSDIFDAGLTEAFSACAGVATTVPTATAIPQPTLRPTSPVVQNQATNTPVPPTNTPVPPTATATATAVPVQFNVVGLRFEKSASQPKPKSKALKTVKKGSKIQLSVYYQVQSAPAGASADVILGVLKGKKAVAGGEQTFPLSSPDPTGTYGVNLRFKVPSKTGTYVAVAQVTIGGKSDRAATKLKVTR